METENSIIETKDSQTLIRSVTEYVVAINRNYEVIMANDLFKNEFGMNSDVFCYKVWKKRDEKCERCLVEKSFQDGQVHWGEETVVMKDGRVAEMIIKSMPVKNEQGEIVYVLESGRDITEEKYLKEEFKKIAGNLEGIIAERLRTLQKSEERYRTMFERSRDAIVLTDIAGKILEINRAGVQILGYKTKEELLALGSVIELFDKKGDLSRFQEKVSQDGFVTEFETRLVGKQHRVFDALITSNVIVDMIGQITGYVNIIRDITEKKAAQRQIELRNVRLATLNAISTTVSRSLDLKEVLNSTMDKIPEILESDSIRIYLFDAAQGMLNLAANKGNSDSFISKDFIRSRKEGDGILGQTIQTCEPRVVDNIPRSEDPYVDSLIEEGFKSTVYIPLVSKGKAMGVMCVSSRTTFDFSAGYVEFLTAVGNQIGLAVDNANLYESIKRAYHDLKEAQEQVIRSEKLASLGKLSATIAHEINNPLAAVLNYIRLMEKLLHLDRFTPERLGDISRYLTTMESETARCGEIVKNLLAFSRQSKMKIEIHSIEEILDKTLLLIAHDLEMRGVQLKKALEPNLPEIRCDFRQIQQSLLNILGNAAEAMTKGGTLGVAARPSETDGFLDVVISDTGCGIPEGDLKNIFEPFFTTKEEGKGVGLGLSVAYGIIARHMGSIEVASEPGKGTIFTVRLPIAGVEQGN
jgi:PAS domain S-box-containing protein